MSAFYVSSSQRSKDKSENLSVDRDSKKGQEDSQELLKQIDYKPFKLVLTGIYIEFQGTQTEKVGVTITV